MNEEHVWQRRFYDFNVWSARKRAEKLAYIHDNPVKEGLVLGLDQGSGAAFEVVCMENLAQSGLMWCRTLRVLPLLECGMAEH